MKRLILTIFIAFSLAACGSNATDYSRPIGDFQKSISEMSKALKPFFAGMNEIERNKAFDEARNDETLRVEDSQVPGVGLRFLQPHFDLRDVEARIQAFDLIELYALRLAQISGSDVSVRFKDEAEALGKTLHGLGGTLNSQGLTDYATPVSDLIGAIGQMWMERKRATILKKAVDEAAPNIEIYIGLLERDLGNYYTYRKNILFTSWGDLQNDYNLKIQCYSKPKSVGCMSKEDRLKKLSELQRLAKEYYVFKSNPPTEILVSFRNAHKALLEHAQKTDETGFGAFVAAMEIFALKVEALSGSLQALTGAKKTQ